MIACADSSFGLSGQSLAILAVLAQTPPKFADYEPETGYDIRIGTFPWFNGREKGVCLTISLPSSRCCRVIAFGEDRASDAIFVEHWDQMTPFNAPTVEEREDQAEDVERESFDRGRFDLVVEHILETMAEYYEDHKRFSRPGRPAFNLVQG